jgi:hypothetical protein
MDKTTKTILIIVGVILGLGACCCVGGILVFGVSGRAAMNAMVVENSDEALELANRYIDFEMPAGYVTKSGINMGFFRMVFIMENTPEGILTTKPVIMIAGLPDMETDGNMDVETMRVTMEGQVMESMGRNGIVMRKTGSYSEVINGQDVEFMVLEGKDENGTLMKAIVSDMFDGKGGMLMIYIMGATADWNQTMIDQFVDSIH